MKLYAELNFQAQSLLNQIKSNEGHFIALAIVREKQNGIDQLLDEHYIQYGTQHSITGFKLTTRGKQALGW